MPETTELGVPFPGPGDPADIAVIAYNLAAWINDNIPTSGVYTPTLVNLTNVATSGAYPWRWVKVGNVMTVSGNFEVDPIAVGDVVVEASLPIDSYLPDGHSLSGIAATSFGSTDETGYIEADTATRQAKIWIKAIATGPFAATLEFTHTLDPVPDP